MNTVIICDDNVHFCDLVEVLLKKYEQKYEIKIVKFYDGRNLLEYCRNNKFDILILDIDLGEDNGLDIAKILKGINPKSLMIYISSHDNYYVDMVQAEPFRFIQKDVLKVDEFEKKLADVLLAAINRIDEKNEYTFTFNKNTYTVDLCKVKYFCSVGRTIHICGDIGGIPSDFYYKMDKLADELQKVDHKFVRISKSYIINLDYVKTNNKKQIIIDGKILSITSRYKAEFFNKYYSKVEEIHM